MNPAFCFSVPSGSGTEKQKERWFGFAAFYTQATPKGFGAIVRKRRAGTNFLSERAKENGVKAIPKGLQSLSPATVLVVHENSWSFAMCSFLVCL